MTETLTELEQMQAEFDRFRRRARRNARKAQADGLLMGVVSMLTPRDVFCDCGTNVGDVTAQLAASGAHVHAFDPDPYCTDTLKKRFADAPNVTIHEAAIGTRAGTIQLMRAVNFDENPKGASVKSTVLEGGRMIDQDLEHAIDVRLLDFPAFLRDLIAEHGEIAFVKMDVEGAELDLLEAMEAAGLFDKIRLTVAETHENKFKELRPRFRALRERLSEAYPITRVNLDWI